MHTIVIPIMAIAKLDSRLATKLYHSHEYLYDYTSTIVD
jgi:hypothetical protein